MLKPNTGSFIGCTDPENMGLNAKKMYVTCFVFKLYQIDLFLIMATSSHIGFIGEGNFKTLY